MDITEERYDLAAAAMKRRDVAGVSSKATRPVEESTEPIMVRIRVMRQIGRAMRFYLMVVGALTTAAVLAIWLFSVLAGKGWTHDALPTAAQPNGWTYPQLCCSGYDCRQVEAEAIIEGPNGYVIRATGEVIPMQSPKVKDSPDGEFHWCSVAGADDGKTICLFVPPRGF